MAPIPKPKGQRARRNADTAQQIELVFEPGEKPELPTVYMDFEGGLHEIRWSPLTLDWWKNWCECPQATIFSRSDWQSLLTTAFVADRFYTTWEVRYATELRAREAAFGATPVDRLRLRMAWREDAEHGLKVSEAEEKRRQKEAQQRYGDIRVVRDGTDG
jgi:hypothetical protein